MRERQDLLVFQIGRVGLIIEEKTMNSISENLQGRSVLIVEDHIELSKILSRMVAAYGMRVCIANSGHKALRELRHEAHDIILLDLYLRDMDGLDVVTLVRQDKKTRYVPIVAITAAFEKRRESLRRGCDDFLLKPFDTTQLISRISALIC
jgi:CheY-like chemotaxis protein